MATSKMIKCQICGASLRKQRMEAHIEKVHINPGGGQVVTARPVTASSAKRPQPRKTTPETSSPPSPARKDKA